MDLDLSKTSLWISIIVGACIVAAASAGFQHYSSENNQPIKVKGVVRDAILGGIFVAILWTFVPESMVQITDNVTNTVSNVASTTTTAVTKSSDVDLQVGPPGF
jgi:ascorbate-specific PTS system EIIC-type component UlaA